MHWRCASSAEVLHRHLDHVLLDGSAYFRVITGGACLVMSPQVRVLRAALWRSLSSEGVPLRCGLQTWGLLCEVCVVLCSGRGRDMVPLVTRGNSTPNPYHCTWLFLEVWALARADGPNFGWDW